MMRGHHFIELLLHLLEYLRLFPQVLLLPFVGLFEVVHVFQLHLLLVYDSRLLVKFLVEGVDLSEVLFYHLLLL